MISVEVKNDAGIQGCSFSVGNFLYCMVFESYICTLKSYNQALIKNN